MFDDWALEIFNKLFRVHDNTKFGHRGVTVCDVGWDEVATHYKIICDRKRQKERQQTLRRLFESWRISTKYFQRQKMRAIGKVL